MTRNKKFLAGGFALAALAVGGVAASAHRGGFGHHGGGPMGHGLMGAVCKGNGAEMADHMLVNLEYKVKPTDAQKPAFEELKSAARSAAAKAKSACPPEPVKAAEGATPPVRKSPIERLGMMEARLSAELDAVRTVRPAAEKFYASLSEDQKKALTEHEHGHGKWAERGGEGDGDSGRGHHRRGWEHRDDSAPGDTAPKSQDKP